MLNTNKIEKVTEKQVIKPELNELADQNIKNMNKIENMNNDSLAQELQLEADGDMDMDSDTDADLDLDSDTDIDLDPINEMSGALSDTLSDSTADSMTETLAADASVGERGGQTAELHTRQVVQESQESLDSADSYNDFDVDSIDNILDLKPDQFPRFTLAKNKARFLRMVSDYRSKQEWLDVAPLSGVAKLFKTQTKELVGIRAKKLDYEMEIEMGTLTPVQISHRRDELKMCKVQEKMAVSLISKMQVKIRSGRR